MKYSKLLDKLSPFDVLGPIILLMAAFVVIYPLGETTILDWILFAFQILLLFLLILLTIHDIKVQAEWEKEKKYLDYLIETRKELDDGKIKKKDFDDEVVKKIEEDDDLEVEDFEFLLKD